MVRPDVVQYLQANLPLHPVETLRKQLSEEGVTDADFTDSLAQALRSPKTRTTAVEKIKNASLASHLVLVGAAATVILLFAIFLLSPKQKLSSTEGNTQNPSGESGFIGHAGWVVRLPKDYTGVSDFKDSAKTHQIIFFCKKDTDPTNFLNEGLFGQLGIVKLEVMPTRFPNNPAGLANLTRMASGKYTNAGEKFSIKNIQVATLPGIQVTVLAPFPRAEAFILGQEQLYFFMAGQEDDIWRDIVLSLRDAHTEN